MYWPIDSARVYAAKVPRTSPSALLYDSDDGSGELVRNSLSLSSANDDWNGSEDTKDTIEEEEDEGRKVGEKEVVDHDPPLDVPEPKGKRKDEESSEDAQKDCLVALKVARSGMLFATITASELTIWQVKPTAVVAHVRRSSTSLESYGPNIDLMIRPDSAIFVVQTTLGYLMTYSLASDPTARVYKPTFVHNINHQTRQNTVAGSRIPVGQGGITLGPGEAGGVLDFSAEFRMVIKVDAGISKAIALDDELVVATIKPAAVQCIRWTPDSTGNQTTTELFSRMSWIQNKGIAIDMVHDKPMNLSTWITNDGCAYAVQKQRVSDSNSVERRFRGYCFHSPSNADEIAVKVCINARFSMVAVACANGSISVYVARDYNGNIPLSHKAIPPVSILTSGKVTFVTWSPDGYCLFAGFEKGWATWSVYGKPGGNSFSGNKSFIDRNPSDAYLTGVKDGSWIGNGGELLLIRSEGDERIWSLEFAKSAIASCFSSANIARSVLHTNEKLWVYRGYDLDDITAISHETSVLWHQVQIPAVYLALNWPIKNVIISPDGRYIAVAGRRGLAHYSVNSGRWKTFGNEQMEQEFTVRGGMCWSHHILIAAVESGDLYELRLYSRESQLDNSLLVHIESLPSPVVLMSLTGDDSLLVYTYENVLYHFIIQSSEDGVKLVQVGQITFNGIVRAPARVRGISWIVPEEQLRAGDPSRDVAVATVIFLVDGKLVVLQPSTTEGGQLKYDMKALMHNVEYYSLMRDQPVQHVISNPDEVSEIFPGLLKNESDGLADSLWAFDGADVRVWMDVKDVLETAMQGTKELPLPVKIPVDFYPLSTTLAKGTILGIESELVSRVTISHFKFATKAELFISRLLRQLLAAHQPSAAVELATKYEKLAYFSHALEVLLHDVLDDEADHPPNPEDAVLPEVIRFLSQFPQYLDVIVGCTRKTEVASWRHLFSVVGSPQVLFQESLARGLLKTAGGYLLVLHNMEQLSNSSQDMVQFFARAVQEGDWDLCKELARFLMALDNSGKMLREALELVELRSPAEDGGRSFMFEAARLRPPPPGRFGSGSSPRGSPGVDYGFPSLNNINGD